MNTKRTTILRLYKANKVAFLLLSFSAGLLISTVLISNYIPLSAEILAYKTDTMDRIDADRERSRQSGKDQRFKRRLPKRVFTIEEKKNTQRDNNSEFVIPKNEKKSETGSKVDSLQKDPHEFRKREEGLKRSAADVQEDSLTEDISLILKDPLSPMFTIPHNAEINSVRELQKRLEILLKNPNGEISQSKITIRDSDLGYHIAIHPPAVILSGTWNIRAYLLGERGSNRVIQKLLRSTGQQEDDTLLLDEEFDWGTVAVNTNRASYIPGQTLKLFSTLLGKDSAPQCNSDMTVTLRYPDGTNSEHTTADDIQSNTCGTLQFIDSADYVLETPLLQSGSTTIDLSAHTAEDNWRYTQTIHAPSTPDPLHIQRQSVTRAASGQKAEMIITFSSTHTINGEITERIPPNADVLSIEPQPQQTTVDLDGVTTLHWQKNIQKGKVHTIAYTYRIKDENIGAVLSLFGPLRIVGDIEDPGDQPMEIPIELLDKEKIEPEGATDNLLEEINEEDIEDGTKKKPIKVRRNRGRNNNGNDGEKEKEKEEKEKEEKEKEKEKKNQASFFTRLVAQLSKGSSIDFSEPRRWQLLVEQNIMSHAAAAVTDIPTGTLVLKPRDARTVYQLNEQPTFVILEGDLSIDPSVDLNEKGHLKAQKAHDALRNVLISKRMKEVAVLKKIITRNTKEIAKEIYNDSGRVNDLKKRADGITIKRSISTAYQAIEDALDDETLQWEIALNLMSNQQVSEMLKSLITDEVDSLILEDLVSGNTEDTSVRLYGAPKKDPVMQAIEERDSKILDTASKIVSTEVTKSDDAFAVVSNAVGVWQAGSAQQKSRHETATRFAERVVAKDSPITSVTLYGKHGVIHPRYHFEHGAVQLVLEPDRTFMPGLYTLEMTVVNPITGEEQILTQDFSWGVLAMNTNADRYDVGDKAHIAFGVLDDTGEIVCDATLTLSIIAPDDSEEILTTEDASIVTTGTCGVKQAGLIDPDFETTLTLAQSGSYTFNLTASREGLDDRSITAQVTVGNTAPFTVLRKAATRLWPFAPSTMEVTVRFHEPFSGSITDIVPGGFAILDAKPKAKIADEAVGTGTMLSWKGHWKTNDTAVFHYTYDAPDISPEFYLIGPLELDGSKRNDTRFEKRAWQIANDAQSFKTWDAEGTDTNWSTAANWSGDSIPTVSDIVLFDGTGQSDSTIDSSFTTTVSGLKLGLAFTGTVTLGAPLGISGSLIISGGTLDVSASNYDITVLQNWEQYGSSTFTARSGTVYLNGTGSALTLSGSSAFNNLTLDNGLVGYWKFDEGTGTKAKDSSMNSNNGTLTGMESNDWVSLGGGTGTTTFYNPYALNFDGSNDYISTDATLDVSHTDAVTVSFWVKTNATPIDDNLLIEFSIDTLSFTDSFSLYVGTTETVSAFLMGDGGLVQWDTTSTLSPGTWTHITSVFDKSLGGTAEVITYFDGTLNGSNLEGVDNTNNFGNQTLYIGSRAGSELFFDGFLDDIRIYDRALGASEILALSNGSSGGGSGRYVLGAALDVNGDLALYDSTLDVSASNFAVNLAGNLMNSGDFTKRSGTFTLDGTNQTLSGSTVFHNLTKTVASADTLSFDWTARQSASGTLTLNGADSQLLSLRSTNTGSGWNVLVDGDGGAQSLSYLDVKDSDATGGLQLNCDIGCTNSTNNTNWSFDSGPAGIRVWNGAGGDANWSTAGNWNGATAPVATDIVVFDNTSDSNATVDSGFGGMVAGLRIGTGYDGTITLGQALTISGSLVLSGGTLDVSASNYDLIVTGDFDQRAAATFTARSGTVYLSGTGTALTLSGSSAFNNLTLDSGLVGYWKLDEGTGTNAKDSSRYGNDGTLTLMDSNDWVTDTGSGNTTGFFNPYALDFDGSNDYVDIGNNSIFNLGTTNFSIALWFNTTDKTTHGGGYRSQIQWGAYDDGSNYPKISIKNINGDLETWWGGSAQTTGTTQNLDDGLWHQVVYTRASNNFTLYVDGSSDGTSISSDSLGLDNVRIGRGGSIGVPEGGMWNGLLDDVRIYDRALSASEVLALANGSSGGGSGRYVLGAALDVNGDLGLYDSTLDVSASNYAVNLAGNLMNSGDFTKRSGTVTLDGTLQTLSGSTVFNNLTKTVASADTLSFDWTARQSASGTLTLNGVASNLLSLRSTNTGSGWNVLVDGDGGAQSLSYLDVKDSIASGGAELNCDIGCTNSANNTNWSFDSGPAGIRVWNGAGGDANWSTAGNWNGATAPVATDIVVFDNTSDSNATVDSGFGGMVTGLRVGTGYDGTITLGQALTISGSLVMSGGTLDVSGSNYDLIVTGDFDQRAAATFTARSGTVYLNGTGSALTLSGSSAFNNLTLDSGLVGYWKLDEGTGTNAKDSSRFGNDGTISGYTGTGWTTSSSTETTFFNPYAYEFDGVDDSISLGTHSGIRSASLWFNSNDLSTINRTLIADSTQLLIYADTTSYVVYYNGSAINFYAHSMGEGEWHHLAFTYDGTTALQYLDGIQRGSRLVSEDTGSRTLSLSTEVSQRMDGELDDVRIYNRALGGSEVAALAAGNQGGGSGAYVLGAALDINGDLAIYDSTLDVSGSNYAVNLAGNLMNSGDFTKRSGTVTLDGTSQTLSGSTVFNNLSKTVASADTLSFDWTARQSASGTLTLNGADGQLLSLRSTNTGSGWNVLVDGDGGAQSLSYLDVKDSIASGGAALIASNTTDSGNNTNWTFPIPGIFVWDGGGGDSNWSTANNWDQNSAPTASDIVIFDNTSDSNAAVDSGFGGMVAGLRVGTGYDGTITLGQALTVSGSLVLSGGTLDVSASNYDLIVTGDFDQRAAATFTARSGTVYLQGTGSALTLSGSSAFNNLTLDSGLVGYWKLDEGTGTIARDSSRNGNDGTLTDMDSNDWVTDTGSGGNTNFFNPYALDFDGVDDYVISANNLSISGDANFTMCAWINWQGASWDSNFPSFMGNNSSGGGTGLSFTVQDGRPAIDFWNDRWRAAGALNIQTWYHICGTKIAGTISSSTAQLYVDSAAVSGALEGSSTAPNITESQAVIGRLDATRWFDGLIDDVRIYNRTLGGSEIAALAAGNAGGGSGRYVLGAALDVNGDLGLYDSTLDVSASNYSVNLAGNLMNSGDFTKRSGTVTLDGTSQTLSGSTVFHNLTKTVASADTLSFDWTARQSASGTLTLNGAASNLLSLRSTNTGSGWNVLVDGDGGAQSLSYLDVKDSIASGGAQLNCDIGCTNSANNTNWSFDSGPAGIRVWNGAGGDANWSTAGNWNGNTVPVATDIVLFDGTGDGNATVDSSFTTTIAGLRVGPSYDGTITLAQPLGISGSLIMSGGTLDISASNYDLTVTGDWQQYAGSTFTARSGTVYLSGTGDTLTLSGSSAFNNLTLDTGLVGYWKLDEGTGTNAKDSSRYGNDGTLTGMDSNDWVDISAGTGTTTFFNPYALDFDGTNDYVDAGNDSSISFVDGDLTVCAWVYVHDSSNYRTVVNKGDGSSAVGSQYELLASDNGDRKLRFNVFQGSNNNGIVDTATYSLNAWIHTCGKRASEVSYIYVDGSEKASATYSGNLNDIATNVAIGNAGDGGGLEFNGLIDDVRIYNRALDGAEITALANGSSGGGSGRYVLGAALDVNGDLGLYDSTLDVSASNFGVTLAGNLMNSGDFTKRSGNFTLDGTLQTLSGSTVFNNLTKTVASADTLSFDWTARQSASGTLTLNGAASNILSLRSTNTGSGWNVLLDGDAGSQTIDYLDVKDSNATGGLQLNCDIGCTNSANNTNWNFDSGPAGIRVWNGAGGDANWSTAGNWNGSTAPVATDIVVFDNTSDSNATVDSGFGGMVAGLRVGTGYDGTITLGQALTISGSLVLSGGTLDVSGSNFDLTVTGDFDQRAAATFTARSGTVYLNGTGSALTLSGSSTFNNLTMDSGLVGYWKLDEGTGTNAKDSSINSNDGTLTNMDSNDWVLDTGSGNTTGFFNPYALDFDGSNDYVGGMGGASTALDILGDISVSAWIKMNGDYTSIQAIVSNSFNGGGNSLNHHLDFGRTDNEFVWIQEGSTVDSVSSVALGDDNWHHIVATRSGSSGNWDISWYLDGVFDETDNTTVNPGTDVGTTSIGRTGQYNGQYFNGLIDDVRIYNRALDGAEITALANGSSGGGSGRYVLGAALDVNGDLALYDSTLDVSTSSYAVNLAGNLMNSGDFTKRSGNFTFDGTLQTLSGSTVFNNLSKIVASADTLSFDWTARQSASGTLTLNGADGQLLSLRSTNTGSGWNVLLDGDAGAQSLSYLDVKDSIASGGAALVASNTTDSGNNTNWTFPASGIFVWDDGGGDNNWSTANNWDHNSAPTASDIVIFDNTSDSNATVDSSFTTTIAGLRVGPSYDGTITLAQPLGISGSLIMSGGTLDISASNYDLTVTGDWQQYAGSTFTARSGTVYLQGTGSALTLSGSSAFNNLTLDSGLVGYWKLDEGTGTKAKDSSINNYEGTLNNMASNDWVTDTGSGNTTSFFNPYALDFDGSNDYMDVTIPSLVSYTYSAWFYTRSFTNGGAIDGDGTYIVDRNLTGGGNPLASLKAISGNFAHQKRDTSGGGLGAVSGNAISTNSWQHVVWGRKKGSEYFIYVDGTKASISDSDGDLLPDNPRFGIHNDLGAANAYDGLIDDIRIYNRALSASEVLALSNGNSGGGSGRYVLGAALDVNGDLAIYDSTLDVSGSNFAVNLAGNLINSGIFEKQSGTVILDGTLQTLSGSTVFYSLTKTVVASDTLYFDWMARQSASGTLTLQGASSNLLSLRSTNTGSGWNVLVDGDGGAQSLSYLDVKDSIASGGAVLLCYTNTEGCIDSGNNTNWTITTESIRWDGGGSDDNWSTAANWVGDAIPGTTDNVMIDSTGQTNIVFDVADTINDLTIAQSFTGSLTISAAPTINGNLTHSGSNATGITWTQDEENDLYIGGNLDVNIGATITVARSSTTGNGSGQSIRVVGNLTIFGNGTTGTGTITADDEGFATGTGPAETSNTGGTHGGVGGANSKSTYGSFTDPSSLGTGGSTTNGGGAIILNVGGTATISGILSASGIGGGYNGAGGSINVTALTLTGAGIIRANGGDGGSYGGGGGRISLNGVTTDSFTGILESRGGKTSSTVGSAGTIYLNATRRTTLTLSGTGQSILILGSDHNNAYTFTTINIMSGGTLEIGGNPISGSQGFGSAATLNITTLNVSTGGVLSADGLGFDGGSTATGGPAPGGNIGGTHGGEGATNNGSTYGSVTNPTSLGSEGVCAGGGAIIISVSNTVTVNGTISADDNTATCSSYGGAGGSVNITTPTISGNGTIRANGHGSSFGGAGGRVAVILSSGTDFDSLTFQAFGGDTNNDGAAGTIYLEDVSDGSGNGELIIDNNGVTAQVGKATDLNSTSHSSVTIGSLTVSGSAVLTMDTGVTLTVGGSGVVVDIKTGTQLNNSGTLILGGTGYTLAGTFVNDEASTVTYEGQDSDAEVIDIMNTTYANLQFTNTGTTFGIPFTVNSTNITGGLNMTGALTVKVKQSWTGVGGDFSPGSSTVILTGTGSSYTLTESAAFNNLTLDTGLVGYWKLDEGTGSSGSTTMDNSRNGNNGTLYSNPKWTDISAGTGTTTFFNPYALDFDGTDDHINIGSSDPGIGGIAKATWMTWIKLNSVSGTQAIHQKDNIGGWATYLSGTSMGYYDGSTARTQAASLSTSVWVHLAWAYDSGTMKYYKNGSLLGTTTGQAATITQNASADFCIGRKCSDSSEALNGLIDNVRIYNRALGGSEIAALAAGNAGGGSGAYVLGAALDINGDLALYDSTLDVSGSNYAVNLAGNLINSGIFTKQSGTVTLDGTNQTLSGSTVFYSLTKTVVASDTLYFDWMARQSASGTLTLQGAASNLLSLRSTNTGSGWNVLVDGDGGAQALSYLDVKESIASGGLALAAGGTSTDSGNNTNWTFYPVLTGTVYDETGTTALNNMTVAISINGAAAAETAETDASGVFKINSATISVGDVITLYLDEETEDAVTVTIASGSLNMTGVTLYQNQLIVSNETGGTLTSTHLDTANNNGDSDITAIYTMSSLNTTVVTGKKLYVWTGSTLSLGGTLTTKFLHQDGSLTQGSNAIAISRDGNYTQSGGTFLGGSANVDIAGYLTISNGTFTAPTATLTWGGDGERGENITISSGVIFNHNSGTTVFIGRNGTIDVPGSLILNDVEVNKATSSYSQTIASGDRIIALGTLTLTNGLVATGTIEARQNVTQESTFDGTLNSFTGTLSLSGSSTSQTYTINGGITPFIEMTTNSGTIRVVSGASVTMRGLTMSKGSFFAGTGTLTIGDVNNGGSNITISGGTFNHENGTITITGRASTIDVNSSIQLNNLELSKGNNRTWTIASDDRVIVNGSLTLTNGLADTGIFEPKGDVTIASTYDGGSALVTFSGTESQTFTDNGGIIPTGLWTIAKDSGEVVFASTMTVNTSGQDLILTGGTLDLNGYALTVNDQFILGSGTTLRLTGEETVSGGPDIVYPTSTVWYDDSAGTNTMLNIPYGNLIIGSAGSAVFNLPSSITLSGSLMLSGGTLDVTASNFDITVSSGSWLQTGGTFTARSGTVNLTGTDDALELTATDAFNNLTLDSGLVGYWKLDEGTGTNTKDSSINSNDGTLTSMDPSVDWVDISAGTGTTHFYNPYALDFDGSNDYVNVGTTTTFISTNSPFSIGGWAKVNAFTASATFQKFIIAKSNGSTPYEITFAPDAQSPYKGITIGNAADFSKLHTSSVAEADFVGEWVHVFTVYNGNGATTASNYNIYLNGANKAHTSAGGFTSLTNETRLGKPTEGTNNAFNGLIDDVRIYNRALGASEIAALAAGSQGGGSGAYVLGAALDINGDLAIYDSTLDVSGSSYAVNLAGNLINSGIFEKQSGTFTLDGTSQTLSGSTVFNNLSKIVASADTLSFDWTARQSASGTLILNGAASNLLSLRSTNTGSGWNMLVDGDGGAQSLSYLDVKDSIASGGTVLAAGDTSTDSGNNTNWTFVAASSASTSTGSGGGAGVRATSLRLRLASDSDASITETPSVIPSSGATSDDQASEEPAFQEVADLELTEEADGWIVDLQDEVDRAAAPEDSDPLAIITYDREEQERLELQEQFIDVAKTEQQLDTLELLTSIEENREVRIRRQALSQLQEIADVRDVIIQTTGDVTAVIAQSSIGLMELIIGETFNAIHLSGQNMFEATKIIAFSTTDGARLALFRTGQGVDVIAGIFGAGQEVISGSMHIIANNVGYGIDAAAKTMLSGINALPAPGRAIANAGITSWNSVSNTTNRVVVASTNAALGVASGVQKGATFFGRQLQDAGTIATNTVSEATESTIAAIDGGLVQPSRSAVITVASGIQDGTAVIGRQLLDTGTLAQQEITSASESLQQGATRIANNTTDSVARSLVALRYGASEAVHKGQENVAVIAQRMREGTDNLLTAANELPSQMQYRTAITERDNTIYLATLHLSFFNQLGEPYIYAPVMLFSDPKLSRTNDKGIATFHDVEAGEHTVEIQIDENTVDRRSLTVEPPSGMLASEIEGIEDTEVILPVMQITVSETLHGAARLRTIPPIVWIAGILLIISNLGWLMFWRIKKRSR